MISILMPVRNAAKYLKDTIESIKRQDYTDWELILINDHCTDNSPEIMGAACQADSRIKTHKNPGEGIIPALQYGLESAMGTFITRMDADDLMPSGRLQKHLSAWSHYGEIVTGSVKYFADGPISNGYTTYQKWLNKNLQSENPWKNIYRECVIASPNWLIHRNDLQKAGNFHGLRYPEDYHLALRWYQARYKIKLVNEVTLFWREHPERTSRNHYHYSQEKFFKLKIDQFLAIERPDGPIIVWGKGRKSKLIEKRLKERSFSFLHMDKDNYQDLRNYRKQPLLVAVYPSKKERLAMESFLSSIGRVQGINYWYV
mgnify:CR=1 FL=1